MSRLAKRGRWSRGLIRVTGLTGLTYRQVTRHRPAKSPSKSPTGLVANRANSGVGRGGNPVLRE